MNILKYIITENNCPLLFSSKILHREIMTKALSAGFVVLSYDATLSQFSAKCFGNSWSIGVSSNPEDELLIENFLNTQFFTSKNNNTTNN
jgi:hypothetical protein